MDKNKYLNIEIEIINYSQTHSLHVTKETYKITNKEFNKIKSSVFIYLFHNYGHALDDDIFKIISFSDNNSIKNTCIKFGISNNKYNKMRDIALGVKAQYYSPVQGQYYSPPVLSVSDII